MVCDKCTKKLSKLATIHSAKGVAGTGSKKIVNENKIISAKQKFKTTDKNCYKKCRLCKQLTHHVASYYCQNCAYQKGICAMCGIKILETKNYKQSNT